MAYTLDDYQRGIRAAEQAGDKEAAEYLQNKAQALITGPGSFTEKMGAGMMDIVHGTKQLFGQETPEAIKEHNRIAEMATGGTLGGRLTRGLGSATLLAPAALIPGAGTVGGAALIGAGSGLLQPTEDESVISGKAKDAAIGAVTGGALQGAINVAAPAVKSVLRRTMDAIRPQFQGGRQALAERAFAESIPEAERAAAQAALQGAAAARQPPLASGVSGAPITAAAATRQPALMATEREAREAGGALGQPFRDLDEAAAQARWQHLQQNVGGDLPALTSAAEQVERAFKSSAKLKAPFDANDALAMQISGAHNRTHNPTIKAELERIFNQYQAARSAGDIGSLHELRMTAFDDALGRLYQTDKNASKLLRNTIEKFKETFDTQMNRAMGGGKWSQYLSDYGEAAGAREQARAGNTLLEQLSTLNETPSGVPMLTGQRQRMARAAAETNQYGSPVLSDPAREALTTVRSEIGEQLLPRQAGPVGSATAQNLNPTSRVLARAIKAQRGEPVGSVGDAVMAGAGALMGGPGGAIALPLARRVATNIGNKQAIDIAQRLIQLHTDPARAAQVLAQSNLPPALKQSVLAQLREYAQTATRVAPTAAAAMAAQGREASARQEQ